jgi:hypothetical protein
MIAHNIHTHTRAREQRALTHLRRSDSERRAALLQFRCEYVDTRAGVVARRRREQQRRALCAGTRRRAVEIDVHVGEEARVEHGGHQRRERDGHTIGPHRLEQQRVGEARAHDVVGVDVSDRARRRRTGRVGTRVRLQRAAACQLRQRAERRRQRSSELVDDGQRSAVDSARRIIDTRPQHITRRGGSGNSSTASASRSSASRSSGSSRARLATTQEEVELGGRQCALLELLLDLRQSQRERELVGVQQRARHAPERDAKQRVREACESLVAISDAAQQRLLGGRAVGAVGTHAAAEQIVKQIEEERQRELVEEVHLRELLERKVDARTRRRKRRVPARDAAQLAHDGVGVGGLERHVSSLALQALERCQHGVVVEQIALGGVERGEQRLLEQPQLDTILALCVRTSVPPYTCSTRDARVPASAVCRRGAARPRAARS